MAALPPSPSVGWVAGVWGKGLPSAASCKGRASGGTSRRCRGIPAAESSVVLTHNERSGEHGFSVPVRSCSPDPSARMISGDHAYRAFVGSRSGSKNDGQRAEEDNMRAAIALFRVLEETLGWKSMSEADLQTALTLHWNWRRPSIRAEVWLESPYS